MLPRPALYRPAAFLCAAAAASALAVGGSGGAAAAGGPAGVAAARLPSWTAPRPNESDPLGGYAPVPGARNSVLFLGSDEEDVGDYNHAAMINYHRGVISVAWKNGLGSSSEDAAGQRVKLVQSRDGGETWTAPALIFPSMSTGALPVALFAGPFAVLNGNLYASATPAVIATGDAQGSQFCLWPDGLDPRNAGPPGQRQPVGTLMLRRIFDGASGRFGPLFWASARSVVPDGFGPASAAAGVLVLNETDAETQADVVSLMQTATPPCGDAAEEGTLKCEACVGACQSYGALPAALQLANERAHWEIPAAAGGGDALVYRSHSGALFAAVRPPGGAWPAAVSITNIPNDDSNINAGLLPDGRTFLVSNAVPARQRDPLTIALSADGLAFSRAAVVMTCRNFTSASTCKARGSNVQGVGPSYPQALTVVAPAPEALRGLYVVATNNKEDVVLTRLAFEALPQ